MVVGGEMILLLTSQGKDDDWKWWICIPDGDSFGKEKFGHIGIGAQNGEVVWYKLSSALGEVDVPKRGFFLLEEPVRILTGSDGCDLSWKNLERQILVPSGDNMFWVERLRQMKEGCWLVSARRPRPTKTFLKNFPSSC